MGDSDFFTKKIFPQLIDEYLLICYNALKKNLEFFLVFVLCMSDCSYYSRVELVEAYIFLGYM